MTQLVERVLPMPESPLFESSHWQTFISDIYLCTVNVIEETKINKKRPRMSHF